MGKFKSNALVVAMMLVISLFMSGCVRPPKIEKLVEIQPNETAFVVPLEGESKSKQGKFMSLEYLEESKVAAKRISLPQRFYQTGRSINAGRWIETAKVITVNRAPVTREWRRYSDANLLISLESRDSIGFGVGVSITALIAEEDAALFLYKYAGLSLADVMDGNMRGMVSAVLSREFGSRELSKCKTDKKEITEILVKEIKDAFKPMGITVVNVGLIGGLEYEDKEVQDAITRAQTAEMSVQQAEQERLQQEKINAKVISKAQADRDAALEFAKAQEAMVARVRLDIEMIKAQAELEKAKKWDGRLPEKIVPQGASFLFSDERN